MKDMKYLSKLIFSYFYLQGYTRKAISSFVSGLLNKQYEKEEEKIYVYGALPNDLYQRLAAHNESDEKFNQTLFNVSSTL